MHFVTSRPSQRWMEPRYRVFEEAIAEIDDSQILGLLPASTIGDGCGCQKKKHIPK
jgi:hypothetical protein